MLPWPGKKIQLTRCACLGVSTPVRCARGGGMLRGGHKHAGKEVQSTPLAHTNEKSYFTHPVSRSSRTPSFPCKPRSENTVPSTRGQSAECRLE